MSVTEKKSLMNKKTLALLIAIITIIFVGISTLMNNSGLSNISENGSDNQPLSRSQLSKELYDEGAHIFPQSIDVTDVPFINEEGQAIGKGDNIGKWSFIFFGYTFCPDICPTTLAVMQQAWVNLSPEMQAQTQVALVSVDIERDTPEQLQTYMNYFEKEFTAFTGNLNSLRSYAAQLNAVYAKVERTDENGDVDPERGYLMDHSANITILDPNGNYYGFIKPPFSPKKMLKIITSIENSQN
ncbi:MAG TPA: SCO family protein [Oceanospirillales bacterium]|nr:SCO family protein [Oleispira sp.]HCM05148.1 SCO family protein [Oceanospirillales bacterium]|tara:strand:+ start:2315 stop:3040 length:726 start_codon:yes stop_codon:yes gene_type:complete